jgi:arylsulfatase A-like enzyme
MVFDWLLVLTRDYLSYPAIAVLAGGIAVQSSRWISRHVDVYVHIKRISFPWLLGLVLLSYVGISGGQWLQERVAMHMLPTAPAGTPNVFLLIMDTLRADHLSSYGYKRLTSPFIDSLASQGTVFEQAFSASSYTLPSHASMLTGRYPHEHGVEWRTQRALFRGPWPTLPEVLQTRGYRTAAFSANLFYFTRAFGFTRGFLRFEDYFHSMTDTMFRTLYGRVLDHILLRRLGFVELPVRKHAEDVTQAALRWLSRDTQRPFFVCLNYMDSHDPYLPPPPYRSKFSSFPNPGGLLNNQLPSLTAAQRQSEIDAYDGAIAYMDDQIHKLLTTIQQEDWGRNTLVIVTSDHGEAFGEHGLFLHGNSLYREVIHVPLIFWWPNRVPAGVRVSRPVSNAAIPATILDLLNLGHQEHFPNKALTPLWTTPASQKDWPYPLAEIAQNPWMPSFLPLAHGTLRSLITPRWQYIASDNSSLELYDWSQEPYTTQNLAERPELREVVTQLQAQMSHLVSASMAKRNPPPH